MNRKPKIETTTLWDFPSQQYGDGNQGSREYPGATPSWVIWNLLHRYTRKKDLVVDPMAGSGTTLDVARDLGRRAIAYDISPFRDDVFRADARKLPLETEKADFVFVDPPYSDHIEYSDDPQCIGNLSAGTRDYYRAMEQAIREMVRVLKQGRYMALYVSDSFEKGKPFAPIGLELFKIMEKYLEPVDVICVPRKNVKLKRNHWHTSAVEGNYFLRGFNYLFILYKPDTRKKGGPLYPDRRDPEEAAAHSADRKPQDGRDATRQERNRTKTHDKPQEWAGAKTNAKPKDWPGAKTHGKPQEWPGVKTEGKPGEWAGTKTGDKPREWAGPKTGGKPKEWVGAKTGGKPKEWAGTKTGGKPKEWAGAKTSGKPKEWAGTKTGGEPKEWVGAKTHGKPKEWAGTKTGGEPKEWAGAKTGNEPRERSGSKTGGKPGELAGTKTGGKPPDRAWMETNYKDRNRAKKKGGGTPRKKGKGRPRNPKR